MTPATLAAQIIARARARAAQSDSAPEPKPKRTTSQRPELAQSHRERIAAAMRRAWGPDGCRRVEPSARMGRPRRAYMGIEQSEATHAR